jgi:hypothetical protein
MMIKIIFIINLMCLVGQQYNPQNAILRLEI